jgi:hypothetical protein
MFPLLRRLSARAAVAVAATAVAAAWTSVLAAPPENNNDPPKALNGPPEGPNAVDEPKDDARPARRRQPQVLRPVEARTAVMQLQLRSWIFRKDYTEVMILLRDGGEPKGIAWIDINDVAKAQGRPAEMVRPLRAAMVAASFPYRLQLEEFRRHLRLKTAAEVLNEVNPSDRDKWWNPPPASLGFLGVELQRRELNARGVPIPTDEDRGNKKEVGWQPILLEDRKNERGEVVRASEYVEYLLPCGGRTEPEDDPRLESILFPGLVMSRLPLFRARQYPRVEAELPRITATLDKIEKAKEQLPQLPFVLRAADRTIIPDYCLVRVLDVTIEPGKTYQYRLRIKMANPNYKRTDVARKQFAEDPVLWSDWYEAPQKAAVPPVMIYYAVDQKALDNPKDPPTLERGQMALQIHRWLMYLDPRERAEHAVGEWVVAERLLVKRGEYVGRTVRADVPVWNYEKEKFVLVESSRTPGSAVRFGYAINDAVLVDFKGGEATHEGTREKGKTTFREMAPVEALLFTHEGKLIDLDAAVDADDGQRRKRLDDYRKRVAELREKAEPGPR